MIAHADELFDGRSVVTLTFQFVDVRLAGVVESKCLELFVGCSAEALSREFRRKRLVGVKVK